MERAQLFEARFWKSQKYSRISLQRIWYYKEASKVRENAFHRGCCSGEWKPVLWEQERMVSCPRSQGSLRGLSEKTNPGEVPVSAFVAQSCRLKGEIIEHTWLTRMHDSLKSKLHFKSAWCGMARGWQSQEITLIAWLREKYCASHVFRPPVEVCECHGF